MGMIPQAVAIIDGGGVIAYPTEYCFGLGCDPRNQQAVERIFAIKQRSEEQGLILIAAEQSQVDEFADLTASPIQDEILESWPGPVTWVLAAQNNVPTWIRGRHTSIAMRITAHSLCARICLEFGHAIVSTSANRHAQTALLTAQDVEREMGKEVDLVVHAEIGSAGSLDNSKKASTIRDGITGKLLR